MGMKSGTDGMVSKTYIKDRKIYVNFRLSRWSVFPLAWRVLRDRIEFPFYLWPLFFFRYLFLCFRVMLRGWGIL